MSEDRLVILVPTTQDMENPDYLEKYWPNFVEGVKHALRQANIKCRVVVSRIEP